MESTKMKDAISTSVYVRRAGDALRLRPLHLQVKWLAIWRRSVYVSPTRCTHLNNNTFLSTIGDSFKNMMKSFGLEP